uniref:Uncharacterized protein n=1 Tax=Meloidogyne enterolobii TaxID=390850 RepID=A0A6V7U550_MELEN|nr:unnamed protein product [Meloidogyne enterolobii]
MGDSLSMTAELEGIENTLDFEELKDKEINKRVDVLKEGTDQLINENEKMIDESIKINNKSKFIRWLTGGEKVKFNENGIYRKKNSNKNPKRSWSLLRSKIDENKGEWNGPIFNYKNKKMLQCKGWQKLKIQFGSYWRLAKEVWDEYKKKPLDPQAEAFYYNEKTFEDFRKKGLEFFHQICERNYISKEKCNSIDVNKVEKPKNYSQVYSPLDISDETLSLIKAILTKKDFLHPTLDNQSISKAQVGIRNKRMIEVEAILNASLLATKITVITLLSVGGVLGIIMILGAIKICVH